MSRCAWAGPDTSLAVQLQGADLGMDEMLDLMGMYADLVVAPHRRRPLVRGAEDVNRRDHLAVPAVTHILGLAGEKLRVSAGPPSRAMNRAIPTMAAPIARTRG